MNAPSPDRSRTRRPGRAARAHGKRSREAILDAAESLLAERGFAGTGIAAIRERSGLPASSIYWFFENKEDLAAAVVERAMDRWTKMLGETRDTAPPGELFDRLMRRALDEMGHALPPFLRLEMMLALERGAQDPALLARLRAGRETGRRMTEDALADAFSKLGDRARPLAADLSSLAIAWTQGALVGHLLDPERIDLDALADELGVALAAVADHRLKRERSP